MRVREMEDDLLFEDLNNNDFTTSCRLYKASILNSIQYRKANGSVTDGILDSLILIEKFDRQQNIPTSDAMRDAFRAVAVHCTLKWLPFSRSSYFDAVQRIWALRIKNLEDSGSSDLLSPDLAQWKTEIEAAIWDKETSQRLLDIGTLGEALICIDVYLNETFRSIMPSFRRLEVSPTEDNVDNAVSTSTQLLSSPHCGTNDGNGENDVSGSAQLLSSTHHVTNDGNVDNVVSTSTQLLSNPHCGTTMENGDTSVSAFSQFLSSPHCDTKNGNVNNVVPSAQLPSSPHPCNYEENVDNVASASAQLPSSPHPCNNDENVDNVASASAQLPSSPHPCNNDENVDNVASASAQLPSSSHPCNNEENVDNVASASAQLPSSSHPCNNEENVDNSVSASSQFLSSPHHDTKNGNVINVASASAQLPSSPHPCNNEENVADRSSLLTPEIEKVRDSLKSSVADLLAAVTDPLPKVLEVADRVASYVAAAKKLHAQGAEGDGNNEMGVLEEAISKDHFRMDRSVPTPSVNHMAEPSQGKEGNEAFIRPNKLRRTNLMEKQDTAQTLEWEDPVDGSAEGTSGCSNRCDGPIDGPADKTNSSSEKCTLPSPKTKHASPLKKSEPLKWVRKRKINRWTDEEEKALMEGVKKYGTQWKLILNFYEEVLGNRTPVDLKDKWRNLLR